MEGPSFFLRNVSTKAGRSQVFHSVVHTGSHACFNWAPGVGQSFHCTLPHLTTMSTGVGTDRCIVILNVISGYNRWPACKVKLSFDWSVFAWLATEKHNTVGKELFEDFTPRSHRIVPHQYSLIITHMHRWNGLIISKWSFTACGSPKSSFAKMCVFLGKVQLTLQSSLQTWRSSLMEAMEKQDQDLETPDAVEGEPLLSNRFKLAFARPHCPNPHRTKSHANLSCSFSTLRKPRYVLMHGSICQETSMKSI